MDGVASLFGETVVKFRACCATLEVDTLRKAFDGLACTTLDEFRVLGGVQYLEGGPASLWAWKPYCCAPKESARRILVLLQHAQLR